MSMYVMPVTSSFKMQLVLTLEIPGVATSPNSHGAHGYFKVHLYTFWHLQTSHHSRKPCGGVGSCTSANACAGEEGLGGVGVLGGETGGFMGIIWES